MQLSEIELKVFITSRTLVRSLKLLAQARYLAGILGFLLLQLPLKTRNELLLQLFLLQHRLECGAVQELSRFRGLLFASEGLWVAVVAAIKVGLIEAGESFLKFRIPFHEGLIPLLLLNLVSD